MPYGARAYLAFTVSTLHCAKSHIETYSIKMPGGVGAFILDVMLSQGSGGSVEL
jgi:hypothetical protein